MKNNKQTKKPSVVTKRGSLGLLAYGDIGFRAWRKTKNKLEK